MDNVSKHKYCYGCGVCSAVCPAKIISIQLNRDGFYEPRITNQNRCIECGLCNDVCSFNYIEPAQCEKPLKSWASWSNDARIRRKCSSGGIGFEIGKQLIAEGYKAIGCRYNIKQQRAEHFIATTVEEFVQSIGSKYIQSYTEEAFKQIDRKQKYLVTGTPCQIDSFRRMTRKFHCEDNFILMDFFCHCVPSMFAWDAYRRMLKPSIGEVTYASWRNKLEYGWHDNWLMGIDGDKNFSSLKGEEGDFDIIIQERKTEIQSRRTKGDLFYQLFLGDICMGAQCEKDCKYKYDNSAADIRIGDLWGQTYQNNQEGVSALVAFTDKGLSIVEELKNVVLIEHPFEVVSEGQMKNNAKRKFMTPCVLFLLRNGYSLTGLPFKTAIYAQRVFSKLVSVLRK